MQRHATRATTAVLAAPASPDAQLVEEYGDPDPAGAYAVQKAEVRIRLAAREHLVGRKVGRTSLPLRAQLGLPELIVTVR